MSLTPVEIRHVKLPRRVAGYRCEDVDRLLEDIVRSFEGVWRDRADLRDEVHRLETELARYQELDVLLRNSLVSAERAADDVRAQAGKEADVIVEKARLQAREITGGAETERERVRAEVRRLKTLEAEVRAGYRAFLLTALDRLDIQDGRALPGRPSEMPGRPVPDEQSASEGDTEETGADEQAA